MKADAFLDVADTLMTEGSPAALRSAVSRAYYAVFHATKQVQESLGGIKQSGHEVLGDRFQGARDPTISGLGQRFLDLKQWRQRADYNDIGSSTRLVTVEDAKTVSAVVLEARALFDEMQALMHSSLRDQARQAISAHDAIRFRRRGDR